MRSVMFERRVSAIGLPWRRAYAAALTSNITPARARGTGTDFLPQACGEHGASCPSEPQTAAQLSGIRRHAQGAAARGDLPRGEIVRAAGAGARALQPGHPGGNV